MSLRFLGKATASLQVVCFVVLAPPIKGAALPSPILFATQTPVSEAVDVATPNHLPDPVYVGRGGDLFICYPDGTLRNLTREAGFGETGVVQGASSIAVRDPSVHWNGAKALFSMVIGAPTSESEGRSRS